MSAIGIVDWPNVRDVAKQLDVSAVYVNYLIHAGRLEFVRTRLGFLVRPESVVQFEAARADRRQQLSSQKRRATA
jgi:excisionase family DNA binding protein